MKTATIIVGPSMSTLQGGSGRLLAKLCSAEDPEVIKSDAYKQGRIEDSRAYLNVMRMFPSGLVDRVRRHHEKKGWTVKIREKKIKQLDPHDVKRDALLGVELWDHQLEAVKAGLNQSRGHIHAGTGAGKTYVYALIALLLCRKYGQKTLVLGGSKGTAYQVAAELQKVYGEGIDVGFIGDGRKRIGDVTVAVPETLNKIVLKKSRGEHLKPEEQTIFDFITTVDVLIADECQREAGSGAYMVALVCQASRRLGFSGTPLVHKELRDLRMIAATGPCLIHIPSSELIKQGLSARPKIAVSHDPAIYPERKRIEYLAYLKKRGIKLKGGYGIRQYRIDYMAYYVRNSRHNKRFVIASALWCADRKLPCLILCRRIEHFHRLRKLLDKTGVSFAAVSGKSPTVERVQAKDQLSDGAIRILLATDIFSRGEDMPACRGLVLAEGIESFENCMQRIGRAMRKKKNGINEAWVFDSVPPLSRVLTKHGNARIKGYADAGYTVKEFSKFDLQKVGKFFEQPV